VTQYLQGSIEVIQVGKKYLERQMMRVALPGEIDAVVGYADIVAAPVRGDSVVADADI
jgi:hypothetical protein